MTFIQFLQWPVSSAIVAAIAAGAVAWITFKVRAKDRVLARQLKLAEFRQDWLRELRECIAEFGALTGMQPDDGVSAERLIYLRYKIEILMNHDDSEYEPLSKCMDARYRSFLKGGIATHIPDVEITRLGETANSIEKREWARIKQEFLKGKHETN